MHRTLLVVLVALTAVVPVFASTTASTCMNITVTVEKFVMAQWGPDVSLTITQSEIEAHPTDARLAEATPVPGTLHIQTNFDCSADIIVTAAHGGNGGGETIWTGLQWTSLEVDGSPRPVSLWWPTAPMDYFDGATIADRDLGPTAVRGPGDVFWIPGRDYRLGFNVGAKNRTVGGLIPSWGTYSGKLCVRITPEEVDEDEED